MRTKVEVRTKALELAITIAAAQIKAGIDGVNIEEATRSYEAYILGDATLPECEENIKLQIGCVVELVKKVCAVTGLGGSCVAPMNVGKLEKVEIDNARKYEKD